MGHTLLRGLSKDGLYTFPNCPPPPWLAFLGERASIDCWHSRLGHPSLRIFNQIVRAHHLAVLKNKSSAVCSACRMGKSHELPFPFFPFCFKLFSGVNIH
jgi:hypothetical protein